MRREASTCTECRMLDECFVSNSPQQLNPVAGDALELGLSKTY